MCPDVHCTQIETPVIILQTSSGTVGALLPLVGMWQEGSCVKCKSRSLTFLKAQGSKHNVTGTTTAGIGPRQQSAAVRQGDGIQVQIPGGQEEIYKQETD